MRRWGRTFGMLVTAALVSTTLAACVGPFATQDVQVAPPATDPACLVGTWKQSEGWQRLLFDDGSSTDLRLVKGGGTLNVDAAGTGKVTYATDTSWTGKDQSTIVEVDYAGTVTLTYSATKGDYREVSDSTKRTQTIKIGAKSQSSQGKAGTAFEGTFVCSGTDLVISNENYRTVYTR
jgi:hypothetical protein